MPSQEPRHAAPNPAAGVKATRTARFWVAPIVITLAVLSALSALYLGGILNPTANLRSFPIAVVNEDTGPVGQRVVDGLRTNHALGDFDLQVTSPGEAHYLLDTARVYGQVLIPRDFSAQLQAVAMTAINPGTPEEPVITVSTNPRAGTMGASIAGQALTRAATAVNAEVGKELSKQVAQHTRGVPLAGAVTWMLANPIKVVADVYNPLPDGTGNGLSAFYYALLLLLAGFTGSIVVSTLVDSMLGYAPAEFGPVYRFAEQVSISRLRTLLVKWALMAALAVLTSAVYLAIAHLLGMPIPHGWALWGYGVFAITAVGITSTALISALGSLGLLVSMLVFVILGLPSAGATVPLEATPQIFRWLATFEPMHQVFLGARALLYLDGRADAGLAHALVLTGIGLVVGLLLGVIVTHAYDRRGYHRIPGALTAAEADEPAATAVADSGWNGDSVIR